MAGRRVGPSGRTLPEDWSDLYAQLDLDSSDYLKPAALSPGPVNPARGNDSRVSLPLRAPVRLRGLAEMVKRCFQHLRRGSITGWLQVLWALSDTKPRAGRRGRSGTSEARPFERSRLLVLIERGWKVDRLEWRRGRHRRRGNRRQRPGHLRRAVHLVRPSSTTPRYLPAESVTRIEEGDGVRRARRPLPARRVQDSRRPASRSCPAKASWWDRLAPGF